ncbi:MAG: glutamine--fructose-6-phosphate transaminase (isomerizing) [Acholeplasmatales bacterium]|nr:glutamine--fructose-6-phosphate transaminase (isomerizing) [Acholeplasmatales bacterium]
MCGIYGIVGSTNTNEFLTQLEGLEYRGYDSCGIAYLKNNDIILKKSIGNVNSLKGKIEDSNTALAIGHTRWATHGIVNEVNAHPHTTLKNRFYVVHNGMIDNYNELIKKYNINCISNTDTEIIPHLLDIFIKENNILESIKIIRNLIKGSYAIVILDSKETNRLYYLKNKSPLLLAINHNNVFLSSDQIAFLHDTNVTILNDLDYGYIEANSYQIYNEVDNERWNTFYKNDKTLVSKQNNHYMLDEILYQGNMIKEISNNYSFIDTNVFNSILKEKEELVFVGAGSAYYAAYYLSMLYEKTLNKRCHAIIASELLSFNIINKNIVFIFLSQSGETADLCIALNYLKKHNYTIISLCNNVNSTIGYNSNYIYPLFAKKEISVASTKAFTAMLYVGKLLLDNNILVKSKELIEDINAVFQMKNIIYELSEELIKYDCIFYIGKDKDYPLALEGALKLREVSYIHSFAFPSGELKHGSIALIDNNSMAIGIVTDNKHYSFVKNNLQEIKSRGGKTILLSNCNLDADYYLNGDEICICIFLQMLAYYSALLLNRNIDQPRNLAKSVTVL